MSLFSEILIGVKGALITAGLCTIVCVTFLVMIAAQNKIDQLISRRCYKQLHRDEKLTSDPAKTVVDLEKFVAANHRKISELEAISSSLLDATEKITSISHHNNPTVPSDKEPKAFQKILDLAGQVESPSVVSKLQSLNDRLETYFGSETENETLTNRLSSYYLPTLELVLTSLAEGERTRAARTADRENLCLNAIATIQNILATHHESAEDFKIMELTAEVETLSNLAAVNGDIKPEHCLPAI